MKIEYEIFEKEKDIMEDALVLKKIIRRYLDKVNSNYENMDFTELISTILVLAEVYDSLEDSKKWDVIITQCIQKIGYAIENGNLKYGISFFGGLSDVGFSICTLSRKTGFYIKFLNQLTDIIVTNLEHNIEYLEKYSGELKMQYYDCISGVSGILRFLIKLEDERYMPIIRKALTFLVNITSKKNIRGYIVPGWYVSGNNQFKESDKRRYPLGNFNFGMSHGIAGTLAVLSIAYESGIRVKNHEKAIIAIINEFMVWNQDNGKCCYWEGMLSFEKYVARKSVDCITNKRMSWCYGTPGILAALSLGANVIEYQEGIRFTEENIERMAQMKVEEYYLISPTVCHGYAGLLVVFVEMYKKNGNQFLLEKIKKISDIIIQSYNEESIYGFINKEESLMTGTLTYIDEEVNTLLSGAAGIILALLTLVKEDSVLAEHLLLR